MVPKGLIPTNLHYNPTHISNTKVCLRYTRGLMALTFFQERAPHMGCHRPCPSTILCKHALRLHLGQRILFMGCNISHSRQHTFGAMCLSLQVVLQHTINCTTKDICECRFNLPCHLCHVFITLHRGYAKLKNLG